MTEGSPSASNVSRNIAHWVFAVTREGPPAARVEATLERAVRCAYDGLAHRRVRARSRATSASDTNEPPLALEQPQGGGAGAAPSYGDGAAPAVFWTQRLLVIVRRRPPTRTSARQRSAVSRLSASISYE